MNQTFLTRLLVAAGLVIGVQMAVFLARWGSAPPKVTRPPRNLVQAVGDLDRYSSTWHSEEGKLDPKIAVQIGAKEGDIVDRNFRNSAGRSVSSHTAMFENPADGVYHSPDNCYRAGGWRRLSSEYVDLEVENLPKTRAYLTLWDRNAEKVMVLNWYQLDEEHTLFSRGDLFWTRWQMRGRPEWRPLFKVLLQTPATDPEKAKEDLLQIARIMRQWITTDLWKETSQSVPPSGVHEMPADPPDALQSPESL